MKTKNPIIKGQLPAHLAKKSADLCPTVNLCFFLPIKTLIFSLQNGHELSLTLFFLLLKKKKLISIYGTIIMSALTS